MFSATGEPFLVYAGAFGSTEIGDLSVTMPDGGGPQELRRKFFLKFGDLPRGHAVLTAVTLDDRSIADSTHILLSLSARVENQGMGWNATRTSVSDQWGQGPTVAELVKARLTLPGAGWRAQALDGSGKPRAEVPSRSTPEGTVILLGDKTPSLWYLVTR
jgi:hypothetical protein